MKIIQIIPHSQATPATKSAAAKMSGPTWEDLAKTVAKEPLDKGFKQLINSIKPDSLNGDSEDKEKIISIAICALFNVTYKDNNKLIKFIFTILQGDL
jgi:hypothetical protein